jgi:hypothetical protein
VHARRCGLSVVCYGQVITHGHLTILSVQTHWALTGPMAGFFLQEATTQRLRQGRFSRRRPVLLHMLYTDSQQSFSTTSIPQWVSKAGPPFLHAHSACTLELQGEAGGHPQYRPRSLASMLCPNNIAGDAAVKPGAGAAKCTQPAHYHQGYTVWCGVTALNHTAQIHWAGGRAHHHMWYTLVNLSSACIHIHTVQAAPTRAHLLLTHGPAISVSASCCCSSHTPGRWGQGRGNTNCPSIAAWRHPCQQLRCRLPWCTYCHRGCPT